MAKDRSSNPQPIPSEAELGLTPNRSRVPFSTKAGKSLGSTELRQQAHDRLEALLDTAEQTGLYGSVGVEVAFERGTPTIVRRNLNGTDRAGN